MKKKSDESDASVKFVKLKKCVECGAFTMMEEHCGKRSVSARPPKFSFADKYALYRRKAKYD